MRTQSKIFLKAYLKFEVLQRTILNSFQNLLGQRGLHTGQKKELKRVLKRTFFSKSDNSVAMFVSQTEMQLHEVNEKSRGVWVGQRSILGARVTFNYVLTSNIISQRDTSDPIVTSEGHTNPKLTSVEIDHCCDLTAWRHTSNSTLFWFSAIIEYHPPVILHREEDEMLIYQL